MKRYIALIICICPLVACTAPARKTIEGGEVKTLNILWQRLVDEHGQTCDRCGTTETAVGQAVRRLKRSLEGLDIDVVLEKKRLSPDAFHKEPLESNRIWLAG